MEPECSELQGVHVEPWRLPTCFHPSSEWKKVPSAVLTIYKIGRGWHLVGISDKPDSTVPASAEATEHIC